MVYDIIRNPRNDLNHAGLDEKAGTPVKIIEQLGEAIEKTEKLLAEYPLPTH